MQLQIKPYFFLGFFEVARKYYSVYPRFRII
jgi:hypothetical protein